MKKMVQSATFIITLCLCLAPTALAYGLSTPQAGTAFEVSISIENIADLYGLDLKLYYDTTSCELVKAIPNPPWELNIVAKNEIDGTSGVYRLAATALAPVPSFSGSIKLAELTFLYTGQEEPSIHLSEVRLADRLGNPIEFDIDGCIIRGHPIHDVAVAGIMAVPRSAYQGDPINVYVTVENQGDYAETFSATVYGDRDKTVVGDEILVGVQTVSEMPPHTTKIVSLIWDTAGAPYGGYYLSAKASEVPSESDIADNFLKGGDYVGGIYPKPAVRQTSELLVQVISVSALAAIACCGAIFFKKHWFEL